jgi:hypothetical protein
MAMSLKKLLVAGIVGTVMIFTANSKTATAAPPHGHVVGRPVVGGYWGRPYYGYPTVYASAPIVTTPVVSSVYDCGPYWNGGVYVGGPRVGFRFGRR